MWCVIKTENHVYTSVSPGEDATRAVGRQYELNSCVSCGSFATLQRSDIFTLCYGCRASIPTNIARLALVNNDRPPMPPFETNTTEAIIFKQMLGARQSSNLSSTSLVNLIRTMAPTFSYPGILDVPAITVWQAGAKQQRSILWCLANMDEAIPPHALELIDAAMSGSPPCEVKYSAGCICRSSLLLARAATKWTKWFTGTMSTALECIQQQSLKGLFAAAKAWPEKMMPATAAALVFGNRDTSWILENPSSLHQVCGRSEALVLLIECGGTPFAIRQLIALGAPASTSALVAAISLEPLDNAIVEVLLQHGAPPSSGMATAAERGLSSTVRLLLDFGADPNFPERGIRPLTRCVTSSQCTDATVAVLLAAGGRTPASLYSSVVSIQNITDTELLLLLLDTMLSARKEPYAALSHADLIWVSYEIAGIPAGRISIFIEHVVYPFGIHLRKEWFVAVRRCLQVWRHAELRTEDIIALKCNFGGPNNRSAYEECAEHDESLLALSLVLHNRMPIKGSPDLLAIKRLFGGRSAEWRGAIFLALKASLGHILPDEILELILTFVLCPALSVWKAHIEASSAAQQ